MKFTILGAEPLTVYGIISGTVVSVLTLGYAVKSGRGDRMVTTLQTAWEAGDRAEAKVQELEDVIDEFRTEMTGMAEALKHCQDQHAIAEQEIAELRAHQCFQGELPWFMLDAHGGIDKFNDAYMDLFGLDRVQAENTADWRDTVPPEDLLRLDREAGRVFEKQGELDIDFPVVSNGRKVTVLARAFPRFDDDGEFAGWIGLLAPQWGSSVPAEANWQPAPPAPWGTYP